MGGFLLPFSGPSVGLYAAQTGRGIQGHMDGGKGHTGPLNSRHGKPLPVEPVQVGYVITGKTDFQDDFGRWRGQYIDLWVEVLAVSHIDFEREAV